MKIEVQNNSYNVLQEPKRDKPNDELGKDDFLKLLITQLRHQDPLNPVDDKEFIAQMAQFSSLEQMQNLNTKVEQLIDTFNEQVMIQEGSYHENLVSQAINLIGKEVTAFSDDKLISGLVSSMKMVNGQPNLVINGQVIKISQVEKVQLQLQEETNEGE